MESVFSLVEIKSVATFVNNMIILNYFDCYIMISHTCETGNTKGIGQ